LKTHPAFQKAVSEIHSRPALSVTTGSAVINAAVLVDETRDKSTGLHETLGWARDNDFTTAHQTDQEALLTRDDTTIKWERHTEFINITVVGPLKDEDQIKAWLNGILTAQRDAGSLISQSRFDIIQVDDEVNTSATTRLSDELLNQAVASAQVKIWVNSQAHMIQTALQHDADSFVRYRLDVFSSQPDRTGRLVQRLIEIETYRSLAYLAVPLVRNLGRDIARLDGEIDLIAQESQNHASAEDEAKILEALTRLSAQIQGLGSTAEFRFSAASAYAAIVTERLDELREERIDGFQRLSVAIQRRLRPNIRSCKALQARIDRGAQRVSYLTELLRTRVELTLQEQNAQVLQSIDQRARDQYRLQKVVETLSIAAISYYVISIIIYFMRGIETATQTKFYEISMVALVPAVFIMIFVLSKLLHKKHVSKK
jgi:uncharacterized membrane-anchored protein